MYMRRNRVECEESLLPGKIISEHESIRYALPTTTEASEAVRSLRRYYIIIGTELWNAHVTASAAGFAHQTPSTNIYVPHGQSNVA